MIPAISEDPQLGAPLPLASESHHGGRIDFGKWGDRDIDGNGGPDSDNGSSPQPEALMFMEGCDYTPTRGDQSRDRNSTWRTPAHKDSPSRRFSKGLRFDQDACFPGRGSSQVRSSPSSGDLQLRLELALVNKEQTQLQLEA